MTDYTTTRRGILLVVSGTPGSGKSTITNIVLGDEEHLYPSISYTTRSPRDNEVDGKDYFFVAKEKFSSLLKSGKILEDAVILDNMYGTSRDVVDSYLAKGQDVIMDINHVGYMNLLNKYPDDIVGVFIMPPSKQALWNQLSGRASLTKETKQHLLKRLDMANDEVKLWKEYHYIIVNKEIDESVDKLKSILYAERLRKERRIHLSEFVQRMIEEEVEL